MGIVIVEPGHIYELGHIEGEGHETVTFIKRSGESIVHENEHAGTNVQSCLRMLIDRTIYLDDLLTCDESRDAVFYLRMALFVYEARAFRRKAQKKNRKDTTHIKLGERYGDIPFTEYEIENISVGLDGHIVVESF